VHRVDPHDAADHLGRVGPVAGEQDHPFDARRPQCAHHPGRLGPQRILQQEDAGRHPVDGREDGQGPVQRRTPARVPHPCGCWAVDDPRGLAEPDQVPAHDTLDAVSMPLDDLGGQRQRQLPRAGRGHDAAGEYVRRRLVERGGEAQQVGGVHGAGRDDVR
jgi:hypothetical protein